MCEFESDWRAKFSFHLPPTVLLETWRGCKADQTFFFFFFAPIPTCTCNIIIIYKGTTYKIQYMWFITICLLFLLVWNYFLFLTLSCSICTILNCWKKNFINWQFDTLPTLYKVQLYILYFMYYRQSYR